MDTKNNLQDNVNLFCDKEDISVPAILLSLQKTTTNKKQVDYCIKKVILVSIYGFTMMT